MTTISKIAEMLSRKQRWSMAALFALMLIGMVLETLGVGSVMPAIAALTADLDPSTFPSWVPMRDALTAMTQAEIVIAVLLALIALFATKAAFLIFLAWRQASFLYDAQVSVSQRLFAGYLNQSYAFHLRRNSAQLIRNVMNETNAFTMGALNASMLLITETLVALGLLTLLLAIEPIGALAVIGVLGGAGVVFLAATRSRLIRWGERRQFHEGQRIQHLQQGLGGAKDVKLLGREEHFLSQYAVHNLAVARMGKREMVVQAMPRLWLELLAVIGLAILVFALLAQEKPLALIVPSLGVFAAAAYRLVPSANRILNSVQSLRYYLPVVDVLHQELHQVEQSTARRRGDRSRFKESIVFRDVSYSYPEATGTALLDVSLTIPHGATVGIIGQSGAGKSTMIDALMGLLTPTTGAIVVDGVDIQQDLRNWQDEFGYVPQSIFLTDDTLRANIAFGVPDREIDDAAVSAALEAAQLTQFLDSLPDGINTMVGERGVRLSGGQRQRIGIARALYHDPSILVLDEATSSLDTQTEKEVMAGVSLLKGKTIIIVAHRYTTVENCDTIFRFDKGRLVSSGPPSEMLPDREPDSSAEVVEAERL